MKADVLQHFPHIQLTGIAMLLFLGSFIGIFLMTYFGTAKSTYKKISKLPLEE